MLPIEIQMQIDLTAAAHKREIAEGFAKLRKKLLPEPKPYPLLSFMKAMMNAQTSAADMAWMQSASLRPVDNALMCPAPWGAYYGLSSPLSGMFGRYFA